MIPYGIPPTIRNRCQSGRVSIFGGSRTASGAQNSEGRREAATSPTTNAHEGGMPSPEGEDKWIPCKTPGVGTPGDPGRVPPPMAWAAPPRGHGTLTPHRHRNNGEGGEPDPAQGLSPHHPTPSIAPPLAFIGGGGAAHGQRTHPFAVRWATSSSLPTPGGGGEPPTPASHSVLGAGPPEGGLGGRDPLKGGGGWGASGWSDARVRLIYREIFRRLRRFSKMYTPTIHVTPTQPQNTMGN